MTDRENRELDGPARYPDRMVGKRYAYMKTVGSDVTRTVTVEVERVADKSLRLYVLIVDGPQAGARFLANGERFIREVPAS